ncbi:hypothetical protein [Cognatishimia activa]|uniref:hypothetical protein n=1 Tax=Cognatishimia activa TaxID=1715691 RepID=UPI00222E2A00|nr:hypothetical protein [Cognatishimia activa]UZD90022.1 hypothetical protein M0D42_10515 [Cognatishimia activa]
MRQDNLSSYVSFGTGFRYLLDAKEGTPFQLESGREDMVYVRGSIQRFLEFISKNNMKVTYNASRRLANFQTGIIQDVGDSEYFLSEEEAQKLNEIISDLQLVVLSEAQELSAFFPTEKRYNVTSLFDDISKIFGEDTYRKLPETAQFDFDEAGKCIVLERGTAACYHLMRGSESVLKQLYFSVVKRGRLEKPMWAAMVLKLEERSALDDALKGTLDTFRKGFRNPVAHPDRFYSVDDAQDLLGTTTQLVALMCSHEKYENPNSNL